MCIYIYIYIYMFIHIHVVCCTPDSERNPADACIMDVQTYPKRFLPELNKTQ